MVRGLTVGTHRQAQEKLAGLVQKMMELGILDSDELVGECNAGDLGSVLSYLRKALLTKPDQLVLQSGELIRERVEGTLFPGFVTDEKDEDIDRGDKEGELDGIKFDIEDPAPQLLDELQTIAEHFPDAEYLSKLAKASSALGRRLFVAGVGAILATAGMGERSADACEQDNPELQKAYEKMQLAWREYQPQKAKLDELVAKQTKLEAEMRVLMDKDEKSKGGLSEAEQKRLMQGMKEVLAASQATVKQLQAMTPFEDKFFAAKRAYEALKRAEK